MKTLQHIYGGSMQRSKNDLNLWLWRMIDVPRYTTLSYDAWTRSDVVYSWQENESLNQLKHTAVN